MSVTRGKFLKELGRSLPGMVLGSGLAGAAQKVLSKMAAVSGTPSNAPVERSSLERVENEPPPPDVIYHGPATGNRVALTFDDGPHPGVTDRILHELKQRGLRATFFMIGDRVTAAPDLARRVLAEGHVVANHTLTHARLTELSDARAEREIQQAQEVFAEVLNHRPVWFRPPYGFLRQSQLPLVRKLGLKTVMWSIDPRDWAKPGEGHIISKILRDLEAGAVILCHDMHMQTAHAIAAILDGILERGFSPVTIPSLMADLPPGGVSAGA
jgi:peptidoglycan/xylan/chitin deacetylase (PgdA/CDA1 family)